MGILSTRNTRRRRFVRAGRERMDDIGDVHLEQSLWARDDDPTLPDIDDDDGPDSAGPDTDTEDDDEPATGTVALLTAVPPPTSIPILSSSTRSIPTLTAIAHTPTFPSSTTTARAVKPTSASASRPVGFTTVTSPTARQSSTTASSLIITTTTGSALFISASNQPVPSGAVRPQHDDQPLLSSPSGPKLSAGAKAGIAIGTIAAVVLLAALGFLIWKRRARRSVASRPGRPDDASPSNPRPQDNVRSQSQIMDELMASAYATQNGGDMSRTYLDEKMAANSSPPAVAEQPQIRRSIASWLRRHHPLDLNPLGGGRTSTASAPRTTISDVSELAPPQPAQRKQDKTKYISVWSDSTPDSSSSSGSTSIVSFYGRGSRYLSDSIRGTWILPPRAKSLASRDRDSGGGGGYV
ncbi:hypothetical protein CONLIGDRAFT_150775 [Coniochaeta ligniaria NRRL 30616]|uniref:Mid2 domain-containing protein n=1 Tax=Coniochaeta ligniaria NRRL 30616 TaxID=1408157 RepID=A0A1J7I623_9PEZI|nr:hypothetical protein CONLIGDRAFT_150775 [Coniochaeta ligniaria NRRL 30616]